MLENIDKIIEFVTMLSTVLFVICRSNANVKKKIDEHLKPNGGSSVRDALDRIEKKLMTVDATQRALLDLQSNSLGHFLADRKGHFFWVSDKFAQSMALRRQECLGLGWVKAVSSTDEVRVFNTWDVRVTTGNPANIPFTTKSGAKLNFRAVPIFGDNDIVIGFVGNIKQHP